MIGLAALPALLLLAAYLTQVEGDTTPGTQTVADRWREFQELQGLKGLIEQELFWTRLLAKGLQGLLVAALVVRVWARPVRVQFADVFLALALLTLYLYLHAPEGGASGSVLVLRLEHLPFMFLIPWLATAPWPVWARGLIAGFGLLVTLALLLVRWPVQRQVSRAAADYLTVIGRIQPHSTVLPLSFNHDGRLPGSRPISSGISTFKHASDYLGSERAPVILLGNYEANTGTFPLKWKPDRNPFDHLESREGLENQPPSVDLANYRRHGGTIDYLLLWGARDNFADHPYTQELRATLTRDYRRVAVSPLGYGELFESRQRRNWDEW